MNVSFRNTTDKVKNSGFWVTGQRVNFGAFRMLEIDSVVASIDCSLQTREPKSQ